jgi:hypothetical protein
MWKAVLATVAIILAQQSAWAQHRIEVNLHWITDEKGCKVWDSMPAPGETVTWSGPCVDGYAEGKGTLIWYVRGERHSVYQGELKGGHYEGRGTQIWPDGARYEGEWNDERAHGKGTYRAVDGEVCTGNWVDGCFQGTCNYNVGNARCPERK